MLMQRIRKKEVDLTTLEFLLAFWNAGFYKDRGNIISTFKKWLEKPQSIRSKLGKLPTDVDIPWPIIAVSKP